MSTGWQPLPPSSGRRENTPPRSALRSPDPTPCFRHGRGSKLWHHHDGAPEAALSNAPRRGAAAHTPGSASGAGQRAAAASARRRRPRTCARAAPAGSASRAPPGCGTPRNRRPWPSLTAAPQPPIPALSGSAVRPECVAHPGAERVRPHRAASCGATTMALSNVPRGIERRQRWHEEVQPREGDQVGRDVGEICVERA